MKFRFGSVFFFLQVVFEKTPNILAEAFSVLESMPIKTQKTNGPELLLPLLTESIHKKTENFSRQRVGISQFRRMEALSTRDPTSRFLAREWPFIDINRKRGDKVCAYWRHFRLSNIKLAVISYMGSRSGSWRPPICHFDFSSSLKQFGEWRPSNLRIRVSSQKSFRAYPYLKICPMKNFHSWTLSFCEIETNRPETDNPGNLDQSAWSML